MCRVVDCCHHASAFLVEKLYTDLLQVSHFTDDRSPSFNVFLFVKCAF